MNTYYIPINFIKRTGLKVDATNETDARKIAEDKLKDYMSPDNVKIFGMPEIDTDHITCEQDDKIFDEIVEDFHLDCEVSNGQEFFTHEINSINPTVRETKKE